MTDLFDSWIDHDTFDATDEFAAEVVETEPTYTPDRYGVCSWTANPDKPLLLLTTQIFADADMINDHGWEIFEGCKVQAERAARRWPLGQVQVVRLIGGDGCSF